MSGGIFPTGGTDARNTQNAEIDVRTVALCAALFYRMGCNPRFDPLSTNAIISELANAINDLGIEYDCNKLDNLSLAIRTAIDKSAQTKNYPLLAPDMDDTLRGSYDGVEGQSYVKAVMELAPAGLDEITSINDGDYVFVSLNGVGRRITFSALKGLLTPDMPSVGEIFGSNYRWRTQTIGPGGGTGGGPNLGGAVFQNIYTLPIMVYIPGAWFSNVGSVAVSADGVGYSGLYSWENDDNNMAKPDNSFSFIVPPGHWWRTVGLNYQNILAPG